MTTILGIDASTLKSGIAIIETDPIQRSLLYVEHIRLDKAPYRDYTPPQRTHVLFNKIKKIISEHKPDIVSLEKIRVFNGGFNMDALLAVVRAQEAASLAAFEAGTQAVEIMASQVRGKLGIKGKKRAAAKTEVRLLVNRLFKVDLARLGYPEGVSSTEDDISDAVAMAMVGHLF